MIRFHYSAILLSITVHYPYLDFSLTIENDEIISKIRKINPNKATCSDGTSGQMLLLCYKSYKSCYLFK